MTGIFLAIHHCPNIKTAFVVAIWLVFHIFAFICGWFPLFVFLLQFAAFLLSSSPLLTPYSTALCFTSILCFFHSLPSPRRPFIPFHLQTRISVRAWFSYKAETHSRGMPAQQIKSSLILMYIPLSSPDFIYMFSFHFFPNFVSLIDSRGLWQWCITLGFIGFLDFIHRSVF
jgi:hypothetical protein